MYTRPDCRAIVVETPFSRSIAITARDRSPSVNESPTSTVPREQRPSEIFSSLERGTRGMCAPMAAAYRDREHLDLKRHEPKFGRRAAEDAREHARCLWPSLKPGGVAGGELADLSGKAARRSMLVGRLGLPTPHELSRECIVRLAREGAIKGQGHWYLLPGCPGSLESVHASA